MLLNPLESQSFLGIGGKKWLSSILFWRFFDDDRG